MKIMNRMLLFLLIYNSLFGVAHSDNIGFDFNSIFNASSSEEGKQMYVPTYQGTDVPEKNVNANNIDNVKYSSFENNDAANFLNHSINTRPIYDTRELGNVVDNTNKNVKNSNDVVNHDYCDPYNDIEYKICYKNYGQNACLSNTYNKYCKMNLALQCISYESGCTTSGVEVSSLPSDIEWSYNGANGILTIGKKSNANYWNGTCLIIDKTIEFDITNLELVEIFTLNRAVFDDYISITLNNNLIYVGPYGGNKLDLKTIKVGFKQTTVVDYGTGQNSCERSTIWNQYINRDLKGFLKKGKNTLKMRVIVSGTGQGSMEFILKNKCCKEHEEIWSETCDIGGNSDKCRLTDKICTKKDQTIKFEGKNINKKCTEYEENYFCQNYNNPCFINDNDCDNYDVSNCVLENKEFIDDKNETEKFTYKCLTPRTTPKNCNQKIQCLDGECEQIEETQDNTQDFLDAISSLSTLNESIKTIDADSLTMLNGENLKCKKSTGAVAAFKDCCGDENWGNSLSGCSPDEEKLKSKRNNNDCIYVGSYCSEYMKTGFSEVCITKKYSFCCYGNKFSKIIGNATRQQGLQTWGTGENTNCNGIPIEQLKELDFTKIDFRELYNDVESSINQNDINNMVEQSLERIQNGI